MFLGSDDPTAWESALLGAPRAHQDSTAVWKEGEESAEGESVRGGDNNQGDLRVGGLRDLDRTRSKLVSLRDAVRVGSKALGMQLEEGEEEGLEPEDLRQSDGRHHSQQWRRNVEESEPEEKHHSWTIHSPDGCRVGEVTGVDELAD